MSWVTLIIRADAAHAELLSDALMEQGALSVDIHDAAAEWVTSCGSKMWNVRAKRKRKV